MESNNDQLCRVCLQTTENMEDLFNSQVAYVKEIEELTGIMITNEMEFPSSICEDCQQIVKLLQNFRNKCKRSEKLLREIYKTAPSKTIISPESESLIVDIDECSKPIKEANSNQNIKNHEENVNEFVRRELLYQTDQNNQSDRKISKNLITCHICGKQYEWSRLKYHINNHTGNRPYICSHENCVKAFPSPQLLRSHNKICHTDIYPFTCDICGRQFKVRTTFLVHRSYHLEPEIPCSLCGKLLRNKRALKKHIMSHTGERPFPCNVCSKTFQNKYTRKIHQRVHTKEKPFECKKCGRSFGYNCLLKSHIRKQHPDDVTLVIL